MTATPIPAPNSTAEDLVRQVEERARTSAKWVLAALGAVAAVVLAGVQLKDLSALTGAQRHLALWGAGLGMAGTFVAIGAVAWIQRPDKVSMYQLTRYGGPLSYKNYLKTEPAVLRGAFETLDDFKSAFEATLHGQEWQGNTYNLGELATLARSIAVDGHYYRFNRRFLASMIITFLGVATTTAGVLLFVANSGTTHVTAGLGGPEPVYVELSADGRSLLAPVVGRQCVRKAIRAISLAEGPNGPDVVVQRTDNCAVARFTLTPDLGTEIQTAHTPANGRHRVRARDGERQERADPERA